MLVTELKQVGMPTNRTQKVMSLTYIQFQNGRSLHILTNIIAIATIKIKGTISFMWQAALITGKKWTFPS